MKPGDVARYSARLEHQRRKLHRIRRELRGHTGADVVDSVHLAMVQLAHAVEALDRQAGEQMRRDLRRD